MMMLSSHGGDKYKFSLVFIKPMHVLNCPSFDITYA